MDMNNDGLADYIQLFEGEAYLQIAYGMPDGVKQCRLAMIYMSENAWIQLPFVGLGIVPEFAFTYFLPRLMGFQKAKEIVYFQKRVDAQQALEWGWVNDVLPHDQLLSHAREAAQKLIPPEGPGLAVTSQVPVVVTVAPASGASTP